jgi:hypothetical protein
VATSAGACTSEGDSEHGARGSAAGVELEAIAAAFRRAYSPADLERLALLIGRERDAEKQAGDAADPK